MIEPLSLLSNVGGSMTAAVTFSNVVLALKNCPEEAKTCSRLVRLVHADIEYAVALRTKHRIILQQRPLDAKRVDAILESALQSLSSVGEVVERLNPEAYGGKIPYQKRLRWFLGDSATFELRTRDLQAQHAAIQGEISWLRMVELIAPLHSVAETKTSFDNFDLWKRDRIDDDGQDRQDEQYEHDDGSSRTGTASHFLSPNPMIENFLHRVPSAQTLVGSVSDVDAQYRNHVNRRDQTTFGGGQGYAGDDIRAELPGSSTFGEQSFPPRAYDTPDEQTDDIGSFFRSWREGQVGFRDANVQL